MPAPAETHSKTLVEVYNLLRAAAKRVEQCEALADNRGDAETEVRDAATRTST